VSGCSVVALIAGLVMLIFTIKFRNEAIWEELGSEGIEASRDFASGFLLVFSLSALLLACGGVLTIWVKNRCCNILLSLCLFPTWLIIFIIGFLVSAMSGYSTLFVSSFCAGSAGFKENLANADIPSDQREEIEKFMEVFDDNVVNRFMCSEFCPCEASTTQTEWTSLSKNEAESRGRDDNTPWVFGGVYYNIKTQSIDPSESALGETTYNTFQECLDSSITRSDIPSEVSDMMYPFTNSDGNNKFASFRAFVEENYECSGTCQANLFYFTKPPSMGMPTQPCLEQFAEDFAGSLTYIGMGGILAGLMLFCTFLSSYCLWKSYDD